MGLVLFSLAVPSAPPKLLSSSASGSQGPEGNKRGANPWTSVTEGGGGVSGRDPPTPEGGELQERDGETPSRECLGEGRAPIKVLCPQGSWQGSPEQV